MLEGKSLTDCTYLFLLNNFKKNNDIILIETLNIYPNLNNQPNSLE